MSGLSDLTSYRRIALLSDGYSTPFLAKTAISLLRYRRDDIAVVLDQEHAGKDASEVFGAGDGVPVVGTLPPDVDAVFVGIAPPGGQFPSSWRAVIGEALARGVDVVSGLHDFLADDPQFAELAQANGSRIVDVRRNTEKVTAKALPFRDGSLRIHAVGQDCSVGKMVATLEVQRELARRDLDAHFLASGQTGIMIAGDGVPVDCVVADFVNGAVERLVQRSQQHDILLIEGQGSISHPSFSAVTLGLLHGCAPHGLIYCYEVGRTHVKGLDGIELLSHQRLIDAFELAASLRQPSRFIGVAMNSRNVSVAEAEAERQRMEDALGLPVCDVYRDGAGPLADAVIRLQQELFPADCESSANP